MISLPQALQRAPMWHTIRRIWGCDPLSVSNPQCSTLAGMAGTASLFLFRSAIPLRAVSKADGVPFAILTNYFEQARSSPFLSAPFASLSPTAPLYVRLV